VPMQCKTCQKMCRRRRIASSYSWSCAYSFSVGWRSQSSWKIGKGSVAATEINLNAAAARTAGGCVTPDSPRRREAATVHRVLGQRQLVPELLQVRGYNRPSQGLRPLWRVEPDLERDRDSCQHATQHNDLEHRHVLLGWT
jgi:hypothetical protein